MIVQMKVSNRIMPLIQIIMSNAIRSKSSFCSQTVVEAADGIGISNRKLIHLENAILDSTHADSIQVNTSKIRRQRIKERETIFQSIMTKFHASVPKYLTVHWDSKLMTTSSGDKSDRLAVVVSGEGKLFEEGKIYPFMKKTAAQVKTKQKMCLLL